MSELLLLKGFHLEMLLDRSYCSKLKPFSLRLVSVWDELISLYIVEEKLLSMKEGNWFRLLLKLYLLFLLCILSGLWDPDGGLLPGM